MRAVCFLLAAALVLASCENKHAEPEPKDPDTADKVSVDRFSDIAGTVMKRSGDPSLPSANEAINFDQLPFITTSLGPTGQQVQYYNFDVQSTLPAPIYVLFKEGATAPVDGQINIIDVIPGDDGYNDFWRVSMVRVSDYYKANSLTSLSGIISSGYPVESTNILVNCPVVPSGSIASKRLGDEQAVLHRGWYKNKIAYYFTFEEKALSTTPAGTVPLSPVYVTFNNQDPDDPQSGPPSGFVTEPGSDQTHNVIASIPSDDDYSPLWIVRVYSNEYFDSVKDLPTAEEAEILNNAAMNVNCPVVYIGD